MVIYNFGSLEEYCETEVGYIPQERKFNFYENSVINGYSIIDGNSIINGNSIIWWKLVTHAHC